METILAAIVGAVAKLAEPAIKDAYDALKALLRRKTGDKSRVVKAVENLEEDPGSEGRKLTLKEDLGKAGIDRDEEVLQSARALLEKLGGRAAAGATVTRNVTGSGNVFSGTGNVTVKR
ncbi:hypothetical protein WME91_09795 [Sorangium sp. So ce269]